MRYSRILFFVLLSMVLVFASCSQQEQSNPVSSDVNVLPTGSKDDGRPSIASSDIPGYNCPPNSMWDIKWPWVGIYNSSGGDPWYVYAGYDIESHGSGPDDYAVDLHRVGEGSLGQWILAPAYGTVETVGYDDDGYGYYIRMNHGNGYKSIVAHLRYDPYYIHEGDVLLQGTFLGYCGSTGFSTGPHVHFSVTKNGQAQMLTGISQCSTIMVGSQYHYSSGNAYVAPPRGYTP